MIHPHERRYSGWNDDDGITVRRFDMLFHHWVELEIGEIPDEVVEDHRCAVRN